MTDFLRMRRERPWVSRSSSGKNGTFKILSRSGYRFSTTSCERTLERYPTWNTRAMLCGGSFLTPISFQRSTIRNGPNRLAKYSTKTGNFRWMNGKERSLWRTRTIIAARLAANRKRSKAKARRDPRPTQNREITSGQFLRMPPLCLSAYILVLVPLVNAMKADSKSSSSSRKLRRSTSF